VGTSSVPGICAETKQIAPATARRRVWLKLEDPKNTCARYHPHVSRIDRNPVWNDTHSPNIDGTDHSVKCRRILLRAILCLRSIRAGRRYDAIVAGDRPPARGRRPCPDCVDVWASMGLPGGASRVRSGGGRRLSWESGSAPHLSVRRGAQRGRSRRIPVLTRVPEDEERLREATFSYHHFARTGRELRKSSGRIAVFPSNAPHLSVSVEN
jgi:hypothetical protein